MAGTYGWNIENTEEFIQNEGTFVNMPIPMGTEETAAECESPNPYIKKTIRAGRLVEFSEANLDKAGVPSRSVMLNISPEASFTQHSSPAVDLKHFRVPSPLNSYYWCASTGEIPAQAVKAGRDKDGGDIFIGRAVHEGELQPAKIVPNHDCAYIAFNGEEVRKDEYEILCRGQAAVIWQDCEDGSVPPNAVPVGYTADNERLFVGRVFHDGTHTPGKVQPSLGACCIPYGGEELQFTSYEVLILQ